MFSDQTDHPVFRPILGTKYKPFCATPYSKTWIKPEDTSVRVDGLPASDVPAIFNVQETGFYRVNYDRRIVHGRVTSQISIMNYFFAFF